MQCQESGQGEAGLGMEGQGVERHGQSRRGASGHGGALQGKGFSQQRKGDRMECLYFDSAGTEEDLALVFMKPIWRHEDLTGERARAEAQRIYDHLESILPIATMMNLYHLFGAQATGAQKCPSCGLLIGPWPQASGPLGLTPEERLQFTELMLEGPDSR
jgi:hypothetical protein